MTLPTFSSLVIKALADVVTGGSFTDGGQPIGVYRSGSKIEQLMMDCNLNFRVGSGSRYPTLLDFLRRTANEQNGAGQIVKVIERVCDPRDYIREPAEKQQATIKHMNLALGPDGYEVVIQSGKAKLRQRNTGALVVDEITAKAAVLDFDTVSREIDRAMKSAMDDPEDAVTAACSLVEAVCRSILVALGRELPPKKDIDGLVRAVQEPLQLSPGRSDLPPEIAADVRQVLSGLTTTAKGIGALRTHAGDAHGREANYRRIDTRIARLALSAASTLALFLLETWEMRFGRTLPKASEGVDNQSEVTSRAS
jgi:Abortive infection C-terminus